MVEIVKFVRTSLTRVAVTGAAALCLGLLPDLTGDRLHAQPPPGPALTVTGTLVDEEGAPAAGLDLDLRPYPSRYERRLHDLGEPGGQQAAVDSTRSGANGAFTLTAPAVGTYRLDIAVAAGDATPGDRRVVPAPVFHTLAPLAAPIVLPPIEVPKWHTLTVGAKDLEGRPIEGALIVADSVLWRSERADANDARPRWHQPRQRIYPRFGRAAARTNAAGQARFSMPTAEANVFVSARGFRLRAGPIGDRGGAFELTPGPGVTVRALDSQGRPAPRVAVTVGENQDVPLALTDAHGEATVGLTSDQSLVYQAVAEDRSLARTAPLGPEAGDNAPRSVEVRLEPPAEIAGRVTDAATGSPVAGAMVWNRPGEQTQSGPTGAFLLRAWLYRGQAQVGIVADGYQATTAMVTAERLRSADGVDIALTPSALLSGKVVDASGSPVASAWLWVQPVCRKRWLDHRPRGMEGYLGLRRLVLHCWRRLGARLQPPRRGERLRPQDSGDSGGARRRDAGHRSRHPRPWPARPRHHRRYPRRSHSRRRGRASAGCSDRRRRLLVGRHGQEDQRHRRPWRVRVPRHPCRTP